MYNEVASPTFPTFPYGVQSLVVITTTILHLQGKGNLKGNLFVAYGFQQQITAKINYSTPSSLIIWFLYI
jgi:hypothetical protein